MGDFQLFKKKTSYFSGMCRAGDGQASGDTALPALVSRKVLQ